MIRVLLVDDHDMMLEGVQSALAIEPDIEIVATASSMEAGLEYYRALRPDVTVTDYRLGEETGAELTRAILAVDSGATVVAISALDDTHTVSDILDAGCAAFVAKGQGIHDLLTAIRSSNDGAVIFPRHLVTSPENRSSQARIELSGRELEVLVLLSQGRNVTTIATDLHLSLHTVRNHIRQILKKLGVTSQLAAVVEATRRGVIPGPGPAA